MDDRVRAPTKRGTDLSGQRGRRIKSAQSSNLKSIPGTHLVHTCVDLRRLDQCKEDKGKAARRIRGHVLLRRAQHLRRSTRVTAKDESRSKYRIM